MYAEPIQFAPENILELTAEDRLPLDGYDFAGVAEPVFPVLLEAYLSPDDTIRDWIRALSAGGHLEDYPGETPEEKYVNACLEARAGIYAPSLRAAGEAAGRVYLDLSPYGLPASPEGIPALFEVYRQDGFVYVSCPFFLGRILPPEPLGGAPDPPFTSAVPAFEAFLHSCFQRFLAELLQVCADGGLSLKMEDGTGEDPALFHRSATAALLRLLDSVLDNAQLPAFTEYGYRNDPF